MELFITTESQIGAEALDGIMSQTLEELSFVTDTNAELEDLDNYGTEFRSIAVIPACVDNEMWCALGWKERKQIWRKKREADIRLRIDYERFIRETPENQRLMFLANIIKSIQIVKERSKGDFQGQKLIDDILQATNVRLDDLIPFFPLG